MAKINHILFGQGKGKVGGLVLQRYEGMNVVREKPISVKNPQTTKQTNQRAKFKSASQIVAQFAEVFNARLANLSIYTRTRRSAAINAIVSVSNINRNMSETTFADVVNSVNAKSMSTIEPPTLAPGTGDNLNITAANGDMVVYVLCSYDLSGKLMKREENKYTSDGTAKEVIPAEDAAFAAAMVVAIRANTEEGRATLSNIIAIDNKWELSIARAVVAGDVEISDIAGNMVTMG